MRNRPRYQIRIYDEAHLIDRGSFHISWLKIVGLTLCLVLVGVLIGVSIIWYSPLKKQLPGYMEKDERSKTEAAYQKVDSLQLLYDIHQEYLDNLLRVLDTDRTPEKRDTSNNAWRLEPDSLSSATEIEREFVKRMQKAGYKTLAPEIESESGEESEQ